MHRLGWKTDLIRQVETRASAVAVPAPEPQDWPRVARERDQYRAVSVTGRLLNDRETRVQAVTALGPGSWVLTPLQTEQGWTVLVNRGFVPAQAANWTRPEGEVTIEGLLRITEPHGAFLRANDPAGDRWRSRDVEAIALARRLPATTTAPYFIDERGPASSERWPRAGLTVVRFRNNHLVYALTWFGLAALSAFGVFRLVSGRDRMAEA